MGCGHSSGTVTSPDNNKPHLQRSPKSVVKPAERDSLSADTHAIRSTQPPATVATSTTTNTTNAAVQPTTRILTPPPPAAATAVATATAHAQISSTASSPARRSPWPGAGPSLLYRASFTTTGTKTPLRRAKAPSSFTTSRTTVKPVGQQLSSRGTEGSQPSVEDRHESTPALAPSRVACDDTSTSSLFRPTMVTVHGPDGEELNSGLLDLDSDSDSDVNEAPPAAPKFSATAVRRNGGGGEDDGGIVSVSTPPGMDSWSSSSSSSSSPFLVGKPNAANKCGSIFGKGIRSSPRANGVSDLGRVHDDNNNGNGKGNTSNYSSRTNGHLDSGFGPLCGDSIYEKLTPELIALTGAQLQSFTYNEDDYDNGLASTTPGPDSGRDCSVFGGDASRTSVAGEESSHNGLAVFFNQPIECSGCQSSAVAYLCDQCTSFYLCEDCHFKEDILACHDPAHRFSPIQDTHCNTSRTFGGSSSLQTLDAGSSLFYAPCSTCSRAIDDTEPVYRCEVCDFITCENCHDTQNVEHEHALRRFQRRARNSTVMESTLRSKSRTTDGNKIINNYAIVRLLGQGSYAKVKLVQNIHTRQLYALKILRKTRRSQSNLLNRSRSRQCDDDLLREIAVMKFVDHPNVVKLTEVIDDAEAGKLYVIMDYCAKGPVHTLGEPALPLEQARTHAIGILAGLLHLHSEFLYHRDIKPANCLVDGQDKVKIADFGTCNSRIHGNNGDGTPAFTCPELIRGDDASGDVVDSWAFALTLYQMAYGVLPCSDMSAYRYREFLMGNEPLAVPPPHAAVRNAALADLLGKMLVKDCKRRMLLTAAAHHPFFKLDRQTIKRLCGAPPTTSSSSPSTTLQLSVQTSMQYGGLAGSAATVTILDETQQPQQPVLARRELGSRTSTSLSKISPTKTSGHRRTSSSSISFNLPAATAAGGTITGHSQLYEKALQEVRRGKNVTDAFYGVNSLRRVRSKDVKNADHNAAEHDDNDSSAVFCGGGGGDELSSINTVGLPATSSANGGKGHLPSTPLKGLRAPAVGMGRSIASLSQPGSGGTSQTDQQRRLSHSSLSDAAFDMAAIEDQVGQQRGGGGKVLELVRLKMRTAPAVVNSVAATTTSLRFALNMLVSVDAVRFDQFTFLKDITITSNQLRRFPEEVLKAPRLLRLDLSHNNITAIPATVTTAKFLERLNLHSNNIHSVGVCAGTRTSVMAAPSLRHVRLSANPLQALPQRLDSTQGVELVLDANPAVMQAWNDVVNAKSAVGQAPPAVVIWDDYFPVRIAGCAYDVWVASGDLFLYRAHTLKACTTPHVVLLSAVDSRFPKGGEMTSAQLTEYLHGASADPKPIVGRIGSAGSRGNVPIVPPLPPRPLPPIISKEARTYAKKYFFVSDDIVDPAGGYHALLAFIMSKLTQQEAAAKGAGRQDSEVKLGGGNGLLLMLTNSYDAKDTREVAVGALVDALCKVSTGYSEAQLKLQYDAVMEAMRSLYA